MTDILVDESSIGQTIDANPGQLLAVSMTQKPPRASKRQLALVEAGALGTNPHIRFGGLLSLWACDPGNPRHAPSRPFTFAIPYRSLAVQDVPEGASYTVTVA